MSRFGGRPLNALHTGRSSRERAPQAATTKPWGRRLIIACLIVCVSLPIDWSTARTGSGAPLAAARVLTAPDAMPSVAQTNTPTPTVVQKPTMQSPELSVNPDAGPPGTAILVTGRGFTPGATAGIDYVDPKGSPVLLGSVLVGTDGTLPQSTLTIPPGASPGGIGLILVDEAANVPASTPFGVTPLDRELVVNPGSVSPGTVLQVSGSGFVPNSLTVLVLIDASGVTIAQTQPFSTTVSGGILPVGVTVPAAATSGIGAVNAIDSAGDVGGAPLLIAPGGQTGPVLQLLPPLATLGESVQIAASGFQPREPVQVLLSDAGGAVAVIATGQTLVADATGRLTASITLPLDDASIGNPPSGRVPGSGGNAGTLLTVVARGMTSNMTVRAPLMVSGTRLTIVPGTAIAGQPITVIGVGYHANEIVTVTTVDPSGTITQLGSGQVSSGGVFSISVGAPRSTIVGGSTTLSVTATGESSGLVASSHVVTVAAAAIGLNPWVVAPGQHGIVQGTSFSANAGVEIDVSAPWRSTASGGNAAPLRLMAATDASGDFAVSVAVPSTADTGPVTVQATDSTGKTAATVLTVSDKPAAVHVSVISASVGDAITVRGSGFASGETVELFLATPAKKPVPLPTSLVEATADAQGSFVASYVPPRYQTPGGTTAFSPGAYLFGAIGLLSKRQGITAFAVAPADQGTPGPTPVAQATPGCGAGNATSGVSTSSVVAYFPAGSTSAVKSKGLPTVTLNQFLQVENTGDLPANITVAYLIVSTSKSAATVVRSYMFSALPHSVIERSVNADVGDGKSFSIIVRAEGKQTCAGASLRVPSCIGVQNGCGATIRVALVMRRDALPENAACAPPSKAAGTSGCTSGAKSRVTPTPQALDAASTEGVNSIAGGPGAMRNGDDGPSIVWYFADGYTGSAFQEYLNIFDPETTAAQVKVEFITDAGPAPGRLSLKLMPFGRANIDVRAAFLKVLGCRRDGQNGRGGLSRLCAAAEAGISIGIVVTSVTAIVAERALYWGQGSGSGKAGYDVSSGASSANTIANFAYASTLHGDQALLSILNPPQSAAACVHVPRTCGATIVVSAFSSIGMKVGTTKVKVAESSRVTIPLSRFIDGGAYALTIRSSQPIVAELAQYFGGPPSSGFHPGLESSGTAGNTLLSGSGFQSGSRGVLVRVFNPTSGRMVVRVAGLSNNGPFFGQSYQIAASAALELTLPAPPGTQRSGAGAKTMRAPIALSVSCSGPCVAAAVEGARGAAATSAASQPPEVWGGTLD